jgi:hypothetical protein
VLEDLPPSEHLGKSLIETALILDEKATHFEQKNKFHKQQFLEDDRKLDLIRAEAHTLEHQLLQEREAVREQRRDIDFAEEQFDLRMERQERVWAKQVTEVEEKLEIVRLGISKTIDERDKVERELGKRREQHGLKCDAWSRELQMVMREQALSQMIHESYAKEIDRVKKAQEVAALEECKIEIGSEQPPGTAGSAHRFQGKKPGSNMNLQQKRGNSTLRRMDSNSAAL